MLSTSPYKGTKDFYPEDQLIQNYIFEKWRKACISHSFEEYQTPIIEPSEIWASESIGNQELFSFEDLSGRKLCLRPEMTPSVTRIVASKYKELPKPIKYFSIGSFYRNERPQKGRNREFWQVNADIFGEGNIYSDMEILSLAIDIMKNFNAPYESYTFYLNHRDLILQFLKLINVSDNKIIPVVRIMDKYEKLSPHIFEGELSKHLEDTQINQIAKFLTLDFVDLSSIFPELEVNKGYLEIREILETLKEIHPQVRVNFRASLVRGFDYYDGLVFEVFDLNPENKRSLYGGGRYNGLAEMFQSENFPAVGFAVGNETFRIFLENWNLLPSLEELRNKKSICIFSVKNNEEVVSNQSLMHYTFKVSNLLREKLSNYRVETILEFKSASAGLDYASKKEFSFAILLGPDEFLNENVSIKDLNSGEQELLNQNEIINYLNNKKTAYESLP
jgi:histidyl-tRNA synthetase